MNPAATEISRTTNQFGTTLVTYSDGSVRVAQGEEREKRMVRATARLHLQSIALTGRDINGGKGTPERIACFEAIVADPYAWTPEAK